MKYPEDFINKIICGDCLEVMKDIPDNSIDMILCDLPYGTTACKWDIVIPFEPLWKQYKRIIKDRGAILLFGSEPFSSFLRLSNIKDFKYDWYWEKDKGTGAGLSKKQPLRKIEIISVFYNSQPKYDWIGEKLDKPYKHTLPINRSDSYNISSKNTTENGDRVYVEYTYSTKHNLIYFARDNGNKGIHPTQKPIALFEYLIKTYTNEGDLMLDNCIGSGTTAVACKNTKRNFIGIDISEEYCDLARQRLANE